VRIEPVIAVDATDAVGPTRLRLLTAGSARLPVVVVAPAAGAAAYHVFDVASLQRALTDQLSATPMTEALDLGGREPTAPVAKSDAATALPGSPVVDGGRLIGVVTTDPPDRKEPGEVEMVGTAVRSEPEAGRKRGLWQRLSKSGD